MTDQEHIVILRAEIKRLKLVMRQKDRGYSELLRELNRATEITRNAVSSLEDVMQERVGHVQ
jgi:hypothetical protein